MKLKTNVYLPLLLALLTVGLVGCGGGDSGGVAGDDPDDGSRIIDDLGVTGSAHALAISAPNTNAIVDITSTGFYQRFASVMVTDVDGNAVSDGTAVRLSIIDSILAAGVITAAGGDSISGSILTDVLPTTGGGVATLFDSAAVTRNTAQRFIQSGDQVLLINAEGADKVRYVGGVAPTANQLSTTYAYSNSYPNLVYDSSTADTTTSYVVGASLLGAVVMGIDGEGNTVGAGQSTTYQGLARFMITYPTTALRVGCGISAIDTRYTPSGSADLYLVASVSNTVTAVDNTFCFSSIAGGTLTTQPSSISINSTQSIALLVEDGGDNVPVPFTEVGITIEITTDGGGFSVTSDAGSYTTDANGGVVSVLTVAGGVSGDAATVTYTANGGAVGTVKISIP